VGDTGNGLIEVRVCNPYNLFARLFNLCCSLSSRDPFFGVLETERLGGGDAVHAEFVHRLILPPPQELVIDHGLSTAPSHVRLGMMRIGKILIGSFDCIDPSHHAAFRP